MRWVGKLTFLVVVSLVVLGLSVSPQTSSRVQFPDPLLKQR
jgi:hypothetical protein